MSGKPGKVPTWKPGPPVQLPKKEPLNIHNLMAELDYKMPQAELRVQEDQTEDFHPSCDFDAAFLGETSAEVNPQGELFENQEIPMKRSEQNSPPKSELAKILGVKLELLKLVISNFTWPKWSKWSKEINRAGYPVISRSFCSENKSGTFPDRSNPVAFSMLQTTSASNCFKPSDDVPSPSTATDLRLKF